MLKKQAKGNDNYKSALDKTDKRPLASELNRVGGNKWEVLYVLPTFIHMNHDKYLCSPYVGCLGLLAVDAAVE